jgi:hypothetical protein
MAHEAQGQHWRALGKPDVTQDGGDPSTAAILDKLHTHKSGAQPVVEAHAGIASVNTDEGAEPTGPDLDDGNSADNAKFNEAAKGPNFRPNTVMIGGR